MRQRLHLVLGFSAGAVIAVAFFDLLPEALNLGADPPRTIVAAAALGFFLYLLFDRLVRFKAAMEHSPGVAGSARAVLGPQLA